MMKSAILHVGLQKTGTSSIQVMLAGSEKYLRSQGYIYPHLPACEAENNKVWVSPFRHNILASTYADYVSAFQSLSTEQESIFWRNAAEGNESIILSAEDFSRQSNFSKLSERLRNYETEIVLYVRRQDVFIESLYNQRNKILLQRGDPSFLTESLLTEQDVFEFLKSQNYVRVLNFARTLENLENYIKPTSVHVRTFDRNVLTGGDVCQDFAEILSLDYQKMFKPEKEANSSIGNETLRMLKKTFANKGPEAARIEMENVNNNWNSNTDLSGSYRIFSDKTRREIRSQYSRINEALFEKFGVDLR